METGAVFPKQTTVECLSVAAHRVLCRSALVSGQECVSFDCLTKLFSVFGSSPTFTRLPLQLAFFLFTVFYLKYTHTPTFNHVSFLQLSQHHLLCSILPGLTVSSLTVTFAPRFPV